MNINLGKYHNDAFLRGDQVYGTSLRLDHFRRGRHIERYDLGPGLTTDVGCAFETALRSGQLTGVANLISASNFHGSGVGATAATAHDIALQTAIAGTPTTATAGTQTNQSIATVAKYQTVSGAIAYNTNNALTEWGLFTAAAYSASTGTPSTNVTGLVVTVTGTPLTAHTLQGYIYVSGTVWGLILENTTSTITVLAWITTSTGAAGSAPATGAYTLLPVMVDRKVFAAVNVVGGSDTVNYTYGLTQNSGG